MNIELIPPDILYQQLREKLQQLKNALTYLLKQEKNQPEGHLRVAQKGDKRPQYYHYTSPNNLTGKYIRKKHLEFAKALAQKDYNEQIIQLLQKETAALEEYLSKATCGQVLSDFYTTLCIPRRALITPVTLTNGQYTAKWQEVTWVGRIFGEDTPEFYTAKGERVRSKSEVIIADALIRHSIPYRYEFPLQLRRSSGVSTGNFDKLNHQSHVTLYPDFLCLNVRTRQEFYWEHFGLMDTPEYSNNAVSKLRLYTENGILTGRNLILTMETQSEPLSTRIVDQMIRNFLL
ncbi:MAG: hypothetical protein K6C98_03695 [Treponema sp.]|nr:hypothetical protein [Treponema sp.]